MARRFRNTDGVDTPPGGGFLRWQWERRRQGLPKEPREGYQLPVVEPRPELLAQNRGEATVTWVGHSTLLLQLEGCNILTDPQFSERASPLTFLGPKRRVPPIPNLEQLPHIDAVLISHSHYDHLDKASVVRLASQAGGAPRFFVPMGLGRWFARLGIMAVEECGWWQERALATITLRSVPVRHWSARSTFDRNKTLWCGWMLESPSLKLLFAGDTGYSGDFAEIRRRYGAVDLAAIPIGHYAPRWFMRLSHVDPEEALQIAIDLGARCAIGIHWGTFPLTDEPLDEPPRRLQAALEKRGVAPERFVVLKRGETHRVEELLQAAGPTANNSCAAVGPIE